MVFGVIRALLTLSFASHAYLKFHLTSYRKKESGRDIDATRGIRKMRGISVKKVMATVFLEL